MSKPFFEVFPTLKVKDDIQMMFQGVEVTKVSTNSTRDFIRVSLYSRHLIQKKHIYEVERLLKQQLFARSHIQVSVKEQYDLSEQYTPENLMNEYYDSFLMELDQRSVVERNMLQNASYEFENGNILCLTLTDTIVAQGKKDSLSTYLSDVFEERFHRPVEIRVLYEKAKDSKLKYNEAKLEQEIEAIREQSQAVKAKKAQELEQKEEKKDEKTKAKSNSAGESGNNTKSGGRSSGGFKKGGSFGKGGYSFVRKATDDPNLIYGRDFDDETIELKNVLGEMGEITIRGKVISMETREIRNEKTIIMFAVTDFTDSIMVKMFVRNDQLADILGDIKNGAFLKLKGVTTVDRFDSELNIQSVVGIKKISDFTESRVDTAPEKRVELHCHTKMSDMDAVTDVTTLLKQAHDWGHPAMAITDHGVVQAFTDANHYIESLDKDDPFKVIYGVEGYLVDDLTDVAVNEKGQPLDDTYVVFDLETTGFSPIKDKIIEIGAVKVEHGEITDKFSTFVNPKVPIPFQITQLTSITDQMVIGAPDIETVLPQFLEFIGDAALVAHNASFDVSFIEQNCRYQDIQPDFTSVDTVAMARILLPTLSKYKLNVVANALHISLENHHRAVDDAGATAEIFVKFIEMLKDRGIYDLAKLNQFGENNADAVRKLPSYHVIILALNEVGRVNLYTLISMSHLKYYARRPRIPKSELSKYREGLLVGSACEAGELYQAILNDKSEERIAKIANFYDYLEIQPLGNNQFMIESPKITKVQNEEDLKEINRKIVALGERFNKPVVGTCDVHFMNPEDEVYRRIIMAGKGFGDADNQPPLYLRTTDEMLEEFEYLGSAKAREIVIENPVKIAEMVEKITPVRPDKCPPVIPDSDKMLRDICYNKAHSMYGENLPEIVTERLERELNSIISNGFAVMYIIAQKLVWKSVEDGYLVGSRGSVGSSFVATMAGITEVNPLSPHYYCKKCHYSDFDSEEVRKFAGGCGWDMPDRVCPVCGEKLIKDGFDIPFETFLGFKGNKEPDIDLNFSGDYQSNAHKYTEVIFGAGQTFRAGTVGTLADKTAFGYVKKYCEERNLVMRNAEMKRLAKGCEGVKRTSGQHPGGIIVVPFENDIHEFCPVQHPADDPNSDIITTHFDYHKIDQNLLKLDELGHDDPTVIRMLEDITGLHARDIPIGDPETMSLFTSNKALKLLPGKDIGTNLGTYGIPEFGTKFVRQMLEDTKPTTFSELVRISGLSHGTDVWLGNAQELIREGKCDLSHSICARDDIMIYLISCGVEEEHSFKIMEMVRKGKGLTPEYEQEMRDNNVPDWYIESCKKIKYMFPKAHAAAYVMSAFRIAYFKVHYPEAFYIAYYTVRADDFDASVMARGEERVREEMRSINAKKKDGTVTPKEENLIPILEICIEMYARGINFVPVDLYESHATDFRQVEGGILPPLSALPGLSENDAISITEERKNGEFRNVEDLRLRTGIGKNPLNILEENGCFDNLPDTDQVSLFD